MSSCSIRSWRGLALSAAVAVLAVGCTATPALRQTTSPEGQSSPTQPAEAERNGKVALPTESSTACDLLDQPSIRSSLGAVADTVQPPQPDSERTPDGTVYDSCIYPFAVGAATTNALTVQRISYPATAHERLNDPYALLIEPEDVTDLKHPAKYAKLDLSSSTEFVLVAFDGTNATKFIVAIPKGAAWDESKGKAVMVQLAHQVGL